jgi:MarR family transcriptional repressor of emrRAB
MAAGRPAFSAFEQRIDAIRGAHPDMPRTAVVRVRLMHHVLRLLADDLEHFFGAQGISSSAWSALMMIYSAPQARANPSALSADLVQSRTHMTRVADELVSKGLVLREANAADRRRIDLVLSQRGRAFIDRVSPRAWKHYEHLLSVFDAGEARTLERLLRKLQPHLATLPPGAAGAGR